MANIATQSEIERDGFAIVSNVLTRAEIESLRNALGPVEGAGRRGLLGVPKIASVACADKILALVRPHLPLEPKPVRGIFFDKSPGQNWQVAWHQDLTLAVRTEMDQPGFGSWSIKNGVPHVQPPDEMLGQMLTVRLHFDAADESNGALRVLPGSHRLGRLSAPQIQTLRNTLPEILCRANAGDALLMRPLLLHASGRSTSEAHRRVLHIEYAGFSLPPPLEWHDAA